MTFKQLEILGFLIKCQNKHSKQPTYREIAKTFGVSLNAINCQLNALQRKGYIKKTGKNRKLVFTEKTILKFNLHI
jgi:hypothetical protein